MKKGTPCPHRTGPRDPANCRPCYLFLHDEWHNRKWGGDGKVTAGPTFVQKAASFVGAVITQALAGFPATPPEEVARRKSLCVVCPHYDNGTCRQCGCFLAMKIDWETSRCPIGKW
jgi:hypothetical protein